jgi:ABC-type lipoprotein export system ATPase subunit
MEDLRSVFNINNLCCAYSSKLPVLQIDSLQIPSGQLIFVIGKSGIGKSTFIETLGLMNNTIVSEPGTSIVFTPGEKEEFELKDSWSLPNSRLASFRKHHFSFIFQSTNLMPNFTAGENMMVSLLIKGEKEEFAKKEVLRVMDRLSLGKDIFNKKITQISGGQRQRLAFVRAITADFSVLFGDEPTGNLDEHTSEELMGLLKELAIEKGKTGIIVSHDLYLAERFADMIIPITAITEENRIVGEILEDNIVIKKKNGIWENKNSEVEEISSFLNQFLSTSLIER